MPKQHIIIVEDDGFLASIYAQKLEIEGFDVSIATTGEDGLRLAKKDQPQLIMLDLILSTINGFQVLEELKTMPETQGIPVLIMTNLSQKEDIRRCAELGAAGYIIKAHALPRETVANIKSILATPTP